MEGEQAFSKRASASGLALYCDPDCSPLSPAAFSLSSLLSRPEAGGPAPIAPHRYVVHPTAASLTLRRRPVPTATTPQLSVDAQLERLHVAISKGQLDRLSAMQASFKAVRLREEVSRWRPRLPPSRDPRAWWRYAYQCIRSKQQQSGRGGKGAMEWGRLVFLVTSRPRYIGLYKRRVAPDLYSALGPEEEEELRRLDDRLLVSDIVYFRTLADAEVRPQQSGPLTPRPGWEGGGVTCVRAGGGR